MAPIHFNTYKRSGGSFIVVYGVLQLINTRPSIQSTPSTRGRIIALLEAGIAYRAVADQLGLLRTLFAVLPFEFKQQATSRADHDLADP